MITKTITITRRTRNLGYGSTSQPVRGPHGRLEIDSVDRPDVTGTAREILAEHQRALRVNGSHSWRYAIFVGGSRVVGLGGMALSEIELLYAPKPYRVDSVTLTVEVPS